MTTLADISRAIGFLNAEDLDSALVKAEFSVQEEVAKLVEIINNEVDSLIVMGAIKMLRSHIEMALTVAGHVSSTLATRTLSVGPGQTTTEQVSGPRLTNIGGNAQRMLEVAADSEPLDSDPVPPPTQENPDAEESQNPPEVPSEAPAPPERAEPVAKPDAGPDAPEDSSGANLLGSPELSDLEATNIEELPEDTTHIPPERDVGGGGLCVSAQQSAAEDRAASAPGTRRASG